jgi:hypothetical protein
VASPASAFGVLGRNTVTDPGLVDLGAPVARNFRITRRICLPSRAGFFNLPNHSNFNQVGRIVNQPRAWRRAALVRFTPGQVRRELLVLDAAVTQD